ncbi:MAG TPA: helix-turn-helix transcriptional regulator [Terriglobia bacterium]|nr:helix-turn-helix transcriptional regulator [Terriglobia bacterium]
MTIGLKLRELREQKGLSQGDIEKATGLLRCYTSRVENGHTVPSLSTLEKYAGALDVKLYELFYSGDEPPSAYTPSSAKELTDLAGPQGAQARFQLKLERLLKKMEEADRKVLLTLAAKLAAR